MNQVNNALALAFKKHEGQYRKYGDNIPYVTHVIRVSLRIAANLGDEIEICASLLHDTKEDTDVTDEEIISIGKDGKLVLEIVNELTNPSKAHKGKPRHVRKQIDREHIKNASLRAKRIKLADRTDNLLDLKNGPDDFKCLYINESTKLLDVLKGADFKMEQEFKDAVDELMATINNND